MLTWGGVHVGDTVRGADGGVWVVVGRAPAGTWVGAGGEVSTFDLQCGERRVSIERKHNDPASVISAADHRAMAAAAAVLYDAFPETEFISEVLETDVPPRKRAAAAATVVEQVQTDAAQVAHAYLSGTTEEYPCAHPHEALSTLANGDVKCTACGTRTPANTTFPEPIAVVADTLAAATAVINAQTASPPDPFMAPTAGRAEPPRGQYGWYKLPHPITGEPEALFPRVSTIAKTLDDQSGLTEWKLRKVARGMGLRPDLVARAAASDIDEKAVYAEIVKSALEASASKSGAIYGSAVHRFVERLDAGESMRSLVVPAELRPDIEAYARTLKENHLAVVPGMTERVVVNPEHNYAGQWDRPYIDRSGDIRIGDLKTGADVVEYGSLTYGVQQALYVHATHLTTPDYMGYETMPELATDKAYIVHLPIGKGVCQIYCIDIIKGWRAAMLSFHARAIRSDARSGWMWAYAPASPEAAVQLRIGRSADIETLWTAVGDAKRIGAWSDDMEAYALARYDVIRASTAPDREALANLWTELHPSGRWTDSVANLAANRLAEINGALDAAAHIAPAA